MTLELDGAVAVVTGGAMGIGRAVVELFVERGAVVVVVDIDPAGASVAAATAGASFVKADVADAAAVTAAAEAIIEAHGGIDILVNAAGIQRYGTVLDCDEATWDEVMAVNVKSQFLMAKAFLPSLIARKGAIVNLGSVQSVGAFGGAAAYVASKAAVANLTRALAADFAPDVRVNAVCPGSVDTPMLRKAVELLSPDDPEGAIRDSAALHPLGRIAQPVEVAEMVAFLASSRASFCTGGLYMVDGGMTAVIR